jgi:hypothetical protein
VHAKTNNIPEQRYTTSIVFKRPINKTVTINKLKTKNIFQNIFSYLIPYFLLTNTNIKAKWNK